AAPSSGGFGGAGGSRISTGGTGGVSFMISPQVPKSYQELCGFPAPNAAGAAGGAGVSSSAAGAAGGGAAGAAGTAGAGGVPTYRSGCPREEPSGDCSPALNGLLCEYGDTKDRVCRRGWQCLSGKWTDRSYGWCPGSNCPAEPPTNGGQCAAYAVCQYPGTICRCGSLYWNCLALVELASGCPGVQPLSGTDCDTSGLLCDYTIAGADPYVVSFSLSACCAGAWVSEVAVFPPPIPI
ncbi:MAG TPA: hypothetical protein VGJ84_21250, partial [Polyangiaceae bacterium]